MDTKRIWAVPAILGATALALVGTASTASAESGRSPNTKTVRMADDCDPATFNAVLGAGTCVGDGKTTIDEFVQQLTSKQDAPKWRNKPRTLTAHAGDRLEVRNIGGEAHSFTEVAQFGGGCVPELNALLGGLTPVAECATPAWLGTIVPAGQSEAVADLDPGTHRFECLIHPWMRTTVTVKGDRHAGHQH